MTLSLLFLAIQRVDGKSHTSFKDARLEWDRPHTEPDPAARRYGMRATASRWKIRGLYATKTNSSGPQRAH